VYLSHWRACGSFFFNFLFLGKRACVFVARQLKQTHGIVEYAVQPVAGELLRHGD